MIVTFSGSDPPRSGEALCLLQEMKHTAGDEAKHLMNDAPNDHLLRVRTLISTPADALPASAVS